MKTFGSLFAGIGGFDLGFERAGMSCKWQVEIDNYATQVLAKHWPKVYREKDIRHCGKHNLQWVDVICGGFPCQDISYAGLGAGLDAERSGLFFEAVRVVSELRPRAVVLENVAALLTRGLDRVLGTLAEIGFDAEWHCIPAAAVGAPHIRDRVFVIGFVNRDTNSNDAGSVNEVSERTNAESSGSSILANPKGFSRRSGFCKDERKGQPKAGIRIEPSNDGGNVSYTNVQGLEKRQRQDPSRTSTINRSKSERSQWWSVEPAVGRVAYGVPNRVHRLRGLGNAVVPQVAELVGNMVMEKLSLQKTQHTQGATNETDKR
jgi:DNA (cytosine-5)-methyltransferase 1